MTFSLQVLKMGECDVAGPEVFWMSHWHEWVTLHFWMVVIRGPGVTAIVNTGPPSDLSDLNARWHAAFGARGEMRREERERPLNALAGLGVRERSSIVWHFAGRPRPVEAFAGLVRERGRSFVAAGFRKLRVDSRARGIDSRACEGEPRNAPPVESEGLGCRHSSECAPCARSRSRWGRSTTGAPCRPVTPDG